MAYPKLTCPTAKCGCSSVVIVRVGTADKNEVHKICRKSIQTSDFLKSHINAWRGTGPPQVNFTWRGPNVFGLYDHWIHTRSVHTTAELNGARNRDPVVEYGDLLTLWALGNDLQDILFQDMVTSAIIARLRVPNGDSSSFPLRFNTIFANNLYDGPRPYHLCECSLRTVSHILVRWTSSNAFIRRPGIRWSSSKMSCLRQPKSEIDVGKQTRRK
ncbi:uncharacterized protein EI97DRAFT_430976 [Westerdykella ornata]|uniref:BTB domain-containing protein n=1 Tax=Westerdykella ornata TaxID=318751 RepID=A0A6A6JR30_WESOR|nr:uncharacterized protein EI97DRAFT_430976 [Westerdykella ornata]KAF2278725.1 hypothetical protein EI97DRAFT_430976 [Westerdykella ornata]